jgi:hypothetical protein
MPEIHVTDEKGVEHIFPDGSTPEMIAKVLNVKAPSDAPQPDMLDPRGGLNPADALRGAASGIGNMFAHPLDTIAGMAQPFMAAGVSPNGYPSTAATGRPQDSQANAQVQQQAQQGQADAAKFIGQNPAFALGSVAGPALLTAGAAKFGPKIAGAAGSAGSAIREAALGDPDAAAMRGLHVSPQSPKAVATLKAVEGSRPFLEGVKSLQDLQERVPAAKQEIWAPYEDALSKVGDNKVKGPDGEMTTVKDLEARRLELSAQLRTLRAGGPEATALAQQKGLTQANLLREESAVKSALDPQLRKVGIDPAAIRKAFGQVSQVGSRVAGKTTTGEASQPSGFGRMTNMQLDTPRTWIGEPVQGVRDLAAGRPAWSTNATDMNIREAFRMGGPRPDFTVPVEAQPQIAGLLPAQTGGPIELPYYPQLSPDEKIAVLMHFLRKNPQLSLPERASAIRLPSGN